MELISNLDLLSVGLAVAGSFLLGFAVFYINRKSITNITFLLFTLVTGAWGVLNYLQYQFTSENLTLWVIRLGMFFAVWQAFLILQFFLVYPGENYKFSPYYKFIILPIVFITSLTALTPLLFTQIIGQVNVGQLTEVGRGPAMILFVLVAVGSVLCGISYFVYKIIKYKNFNIERRPALFILLGTFLMFFLIILFNFVFPNVFLNVKIAPLGALFVLPFVFFVAFALSKSRLMNPKVLGISVLAFFLTISTFLETILSKDLYLVAFRSFVFILVLVVSIILIRVMVREVRQREKIEALALDLEKANDRLEIANEKLKELDKQKTEFVSIASHQLRSPVTAIKGYSSMLLEGDYGILGDQVKEVVQVIFESSQKLILVIEDFLNVTRIELGKMKYEMSEFDLADLSKTVINELKPMIEKRGLTLNFTKARGKFLVNADYGKISQVVGNLIDNANKYTKQGTITVRLERREEGGQGHIRFAVSDTGIGIKQETMPHLFEKFIRAVDAGKTNIIGTGLGLYVAKQIVEAHNGRIWAESEGIGKGSTFLVELKDPHYLETNKEQDISIGNLATQAVTIQKNT